MVTAASPSGVRRCTLSHLQIPRQATLRPSGYVGGPDRAKPCYNTIKSPLKDDADGWRAVGIVFRGYTLSPLLWQREQELAQYNAQQGRVFRVVGEKLPLDDETAEGFPVVSDGQREDW